MNARGRTRTDVASGTTTRRGALGLAGGAALLAFAGSGSGRSVLAQEASPVASAGGGDLNGKYVVIRLRTVQPDRSSDELLTMIQDGFVPLLEDIPGFIWYVAGANAESSSFISVGVFADEAGAAESNSRAAAWVEQSAPDFFEGDPTMFEGVIGVAADASGMAGAGTPEASAPAGGLIGAYVVVRLRQPNPDWSVEEVMRQVGEGFVPLVREIPGFVSYFGSADPAGGQAYVGVFADKAGADESTRVAGEWLTENSYTFFEGDPTVAEGIVGAAAEAAS